MMWRQLLPAALWSALAGSALATCPTADDLAKTGIWIALQDDGANHYSLRPDGQIREVQVFNDGSGFYLDAHYGVFVTRDGSLSNGRVNREPNSHFSYDQPTGSLPSPAAPGAWHGVISIVDAESGKESSEIYTVAYGPESTLSIGPCSYRSRLVTAASVYDNGEKAVGEMHYLLDLGFSFYMSNGETVGSPNNIYTPVRISTTDPRVPE